MAKLREFRAAYPYPRGDFALPARTAQERYRVAGGSRLVRRGSDFAVKSADTTVPIRPGDAPLVSWMVERGCFTRGEFDVRFAAVAEADRQRMLNELSVHRLIALA